MDLPTTILTGGIEAPMRVLTSAYVTEKVSELKASGHNEVTESKIKDSLLLVLTGKIPVSDIDKAIYSDIFPE